MHNYNERADIERAILQLIKILIVGLRVQSFFKRQEPLVGISDN